MDFRKKLKIRLGVAIGYMALGAMMCALFCGLALKNEYISVLGAALITVGALQMVKYFRITRSEESVRSREIKEKDERNVSIAHRAKSMAFSMYILLACAASIVLGIMGRAQIAQVLSGNVCVMLVIYWVSYFIIRNKS